MQSRRVTDRLDAREFPVGRVEAFYKGADEKVWNSPPAFGQGIAGTAKAMAESCAVSEDRRRAIPSRWNQAPGRGCAGPVMSIGGMSPTTTTESVGPTLDDDR